MVKTEGDSAGDLHPFKCYDRVCEIKSYEVRNGGMREIVRIFLVERSYEEARSRVFRIDTSIHLLQSQKKTVQSFLYRYSVLKYNLVLVRKA